MIQINKQTPLGIWFPCVKAGTGSDMFTIRLAEALEKHGVRTKITWLPHHAEYLPWLVKKTKPPSWATHVHINSWLHKRFIPSELPIIVTSHLCVHDPKLTSYKSLAQRIYHFIWVKYCEQYAFKAATKITAVSSYTAKQNESIFDIKAISAIHNWIDSSVFTAAINKPTNKKFKLLYVGNLSFRKGSDLLPKIMKKLGGNYELYYTGNSDKFYGKKNIPDNMHSLGIINHQDELIKSYQNSDALLFPTRLEGLSLAAIEAQACGLPIITTNGSSMPEIVEEGLTGYLCEQDNVDEFVASIKKLQKEPEVSFNMRLNASINAKERFSESTQIKAYIELYNQI
ncbi:hypothetical protein CMT41_15465 [Colwellia sp. MT41]|nr:hypothetical protein CMT41_15465 [Colwellia sp. MT41]